MRLAKRRDPWRVNDIGESLEMPTANVTRAVDRLVQRGWVKRMGSERDRKAVFVVPTEDGEFQERIISEKSNELAEELLWSKLTPADQEAIGDVGSVVIDGLRRRPRRRAQRGFCRLATDRLGTKRKRDAAEKLSYAEPLLGVSAEAIGEPSELGPNLVPTWRTFWGTNKKGQSVQGSDLAF